MSPDSIWMSGSARSGKTTRLIDRFCAWSQPTPIAPQSVSAAIALVFAANGDNRLELADRLAEATQGQVPFDSTTPLGFFQDEVILFYPLLVEKLGLPAQFPLRLRPETEQELATQLWSEPLESGRLRQEGVPDYYMVRRSLDLLQLAALAEVPTEDIATMLKNGFAGQEGGSDALWECIGEVLLQWREWCLERGLLTYGILTELYGRHLLPDATYQQHLFRRYNRLFADDVDEYPAIAQTLFTTLLDHGIPGCFTFNPNGSLRLGLGADPECLVNLADRCQVEPCTQPVDASLGAEWGAAIVGWVDEPFLLPELPAAIQGIQTTSRAQLLRQTAETIAQAIHSRQVEPQEVAVIGPGLDAIARYTLKEILMNRGIAVESLSDQQPLISSSLVRSLLTLLALVYPGLGHRLTSDAVAEMLVVLSQPAVFEGQTGLELAAIDPVRAGLLTDHCFVSDLDRPHLLPATHFPRWDRLGFRATQSYTAILQWLEAQILQQQQRLIPSPVTLLDRAIQHFFYGGSHLPYDQLAALRELMETAQHYWDVDKRLRQSDTQLAPTQARSEMPIGATVGQFIQLLQNGTITADPYPARPVGGTSQAVTLATIFQYRSNRRAHRWQFWLDAGSSLWLTGGGALFGAPLFLQSWSGRAWTAADALAFDQQRLQRQLLDLLGRVSDVKHFSPGNHRLYLCHSDLATNGQEQNGPLLTLVNRAIPVTQELALEV
uniref:recombinase family protein n=2 Tax=Oscillatoria sp. FACHB-1407 TaxID=2692847 RepID=UPI0030DB5DEE